MREERKPQCNEWNTEQFSVTLKVIYLCRQSISHVLECNPPTPTITPTVCMNVCMCVCCGVCDEALLLFLQRWELVGEEALLNHTDKINM